MGTRLFLLLCVCLAFGYVGHADTIQLNDLGESVSVTLNGTPITGNGGRISNFILAGESVSFDISTNGNNFINTTRFTNLLDPLTSDDPVGTVSDRLLQTTILGAATYHIVMGSDPALPAIPPGAEDLAPILGLPSPYFENGTPQLVDTIFNSNGTVLDTFFIQSDVPEPSSTVPIILIGTGLVLRLARRKNRQPRLGT
jgi:hypothetical protein